MAPGRHDTQRKDTQLNDIRHMTPSTTTFSIIALNIMAEFCYAECHYAECHFPECHYPECHYAECHCAECRGVHRPYLPWPQSTKNPICVISAKVAKASTVMTLPMAFSPLFSTINFANVNILLTEMSRLNCKYSPFIKTH